MAASLRKKAELAGRAGFEETVHDVEAIVSASEVDGNADNLHADNPNPNPRSDKEIQPAANVLPEPALSIIGHDHFVYYAYLDSIGNTRILGPDTNKFTDLSTRSIRGIFALLRLYGRILEYGMDERGFGGHVIGQVLNGLVADR